MSEPVVPVAEANGAAVYRAHWHDLLSAVPQCDAVVVDAPYSERTHNGHGTMERWGTGLPPTYDGGDRREIEYQHWTPDDVHAFVRAWHMVCAGWMVSITDHVLGPAWEAAMREVGRYVFPPLPYVAPGSRVRLAGDGPSNWTCFIIVSRPRAREFSTWGTLPGAYILPPGMGERMPVVGGKPSWLAHRLVEDYSRPGDLVVDPCCGAGSTLVGAIRAGRRAIGGDIDRKHAEIAAQWIRAPYGPPPGQKALALPDGQADLFELLRGES